jgi:hypothetical protein
MKSQSRVALISALLLASPLIGFAGSQSVPRMPLKSEAQDRTGVTQAVQQGKGGGTSRNQGVQANAYREQTAAEGQVVKETTRNAHPNWGDPAFHR